jgi:hypothetical protein
LVNRWAPFWHQLGQGLVNPRMFRSVLAAPRGGERLFVVPGLRDAALGALAARLGQHGLMTHQVDAAAAVSRGANGS